MADSNLKFLRNCTNEELDFLVQIILDKGHLTENLSSYEDYKKYNPDHKKYIGKICDEILDFGSNTLWFQKSYREVLKIVCDKMDLSYSSSDGVRKIEEDMLAKVFEQMWDEMTEEGRKALIQNLDESEDMRPNKGAALFITAFRLGGFKSYQLSVFIANSLSKLIFNRGLSFVANSTLTKALSVLTGPVGWTLTTLWTVVDIAGPAYRVIVPAVIYIATLRRMHMYEESGG